MTCPYIPSYKEMVANMDLVDLRTPVLRDVLKDIHLFSAHADGIAYGKGYLLVKGGNLKHYAGLEYCRPILETLEFSMYEMDGSDDQVADVLTVIDHVTGRHQEAA